MKKTGKTDKAKHRRSFALLFLLAVILALSGCPARGEAQGEAVKQDNGTGSAASPELEKELSRQSIAVEVSEEEDDVEYTIIEEAPENP